MSVFEKVGKRFEDKQGPGVQRFRDLTASETSFVRSETKKTVQARQGTISADNLGTGFLDKISTGQQTTSVTGPADLSRANLSVEEKQRLSAAAKTRVKTIQQRLATPGRSLFLSGV